MTDRNEVGYFRPGHTVKSPGRPPGPSRAELIATYLEPHRVEILAKAVELAKLGDPHAMKLVLERLAPIPKQDAERVVVPGLRDATTLAAKATAILAAVADGHVSAEAGDRLLGMLDKYGKAVVLDEHERRLQAIEAGRTQVLPALPTPTPAVADYCDLA